MKTGRGQDGSGGEGDGRGSAARRVVVVSRSCGASWPPGRGHVRKRGRERRTRAGRGRFRLRGSPRGSAVAVPSDGRAEATKETTRASVSSRARAEGERKRRRPSAGVVSTRASACPRARTSLHCALVMSAEPATYPVTLSVYACSCASARGRSSAASATVHTAAAIARRAISPAGTASRRRSGVGRRAAPRSFPRIAKADRDATRGVLRSNLPVFERNSGCKLYEVASGKNSGEIIWENSLQIPRGWLRTSQDIAASPSGTLTVRAFGDFNETTSLGLATTTRSEPRRRVSSSANRAKAARRAPDAVTVGRCLRVRRARGSARR
jgi:hypothetical protein